MVTTKRIIWFSYALGVGMTVVVGNWLALSWSINACIAWYCLMRQEELTK